MTQRRNAYVSDRLAQALILVLLVIATLALAWWAYFPGLSGDFLFDDFVNLPALGMTGPVDNWAAFWRYITSGTADITGRPLTLLTFLIDAHNWPAKPYPFKLTNLILHLINGVLLGWVLWKLGRVLPASSNPSSLRTLRSGGPESNSSKEVDFRFDPWRRPGTTLDQRGCAIAALFGAGAWLLHPLLVSTTLYIVQREAMLPATFELVGMLGWMASRTVLARGHTKRAMVGMAMSAWLCTVLATLSKANGALFPILLLLTEWIVLSRKPMPDGAQRAWHRRAVAIFLILPSMLVLGYLVYRLPSAIHDTADVRGWSVGQRVLTEPRVLVDYLRLLFVPHVHSTGLFNDQFGASTGWLHPVSTLPCIALIAALIGLGIALRKRHPAIALALLFYFAGQLMESGWIPLELYFEHRNYIPAMLLFWPIGLALGKPASLRFLKLAAGAVVLVVLAVMTWQRATLWGDGLRQAQVWAAINPGSARAQTSAAQYEMQNGFPHLAVARLRLSIPRHPDDLQGPINLIGAECKLGAVRPSTLANVDATLRRTRLGGSIAFKWFNEALAIANQRACTGLDLAALQATLNAARHNPYWRTQVGTQQNLAHLQGELDLSQGKPTQALSSFNRAIRILTKPGTALEQAAYLGAHGYPKLGLEHLDYYATLPPGPKPGLGMPLIHAWVLREQNWWPNELAYLRRNLAEDVASKAAAGSAGQ